MATPPKKLYCPICGAAYDTISELQDPIKSHES